MDTGEVTFQKNMFAEINSACAGWLQKFRNERVWLFFFFSSVSLLNVQIWKAEKISRGVHESAGGVGFTID